MKRMIIISLAGLLMAGQTAAQETSADQLLDTVSVTAHKFEEMRRSVAQQTLVLDAATLARSTGNSTAAVLEQDGRVFVQRSQQGGGSPVLHGFEASRVLLVLDGVRMNNAIYRTGHLQNIITTDENMLDKIDLLYGPSSTIYGSDALGGVIHLQTRNPELATKGRTLLKTGALLRYSSASNEATGHIDIDAGGRRIASLTSVTASRYGDLRQGGSRSGDYPDFGEREFYVTRVNGIDSAMRNNDPNLQRGSGYRQIDVIQKLRWQPSAHQQHLLNLQYSNSSDIPRYDRLTDRRNGQLRWAEWYYGPQERWMAAYSYQADALKGLFDQVILNIHYQDIKESRVQRAYRKDNKEHRNEHIKVPGFSAGFGKRSGRHEWNVGADGQFSFLNSAAWSENIVSGEKKYGLDTRYPDGSNTMSYTGVYVQHACTLAGGRWILNDGIRVNYTSLRSVFKDTSILHLPFTSAAQRNVTYSADAGIVFLPDNRNRFTLGTATGFRTPNIDDLAKVFESAGGASLVVPNPSLKPEQTLSLNLGGSHRAGNWFTAEWNAFYTFFRDAIVTDRFLFNGRDSVMYSGQLTAVTASQNKAKARLYGFDASITLRPLPGITLFSCLAYTHGRYTGADGNAVPLDHVPPVYGKTALSWEHKGFRATCYARYSGWKKAADYNPYGEDNLQYATGNGMPGWCTFNLTAGCDLQKHLKIQAAVENIFDRNYRAFASGISSPGRNVVLKLAATF